MGKRPRAPSSPSSMQQQPPPSPKKIHLQESSSSFFDQLHDDAIIQIMRFLKLETIYDLQHVCKRLRALAELLIRQASSTDPGHIGRARCRHVTGTTTKPWTLACVACSKKPQYARMQARSACNLFAVSRKQLKEIPCLVLWDGKSTRYRHHLVKYYMTTDVAALAKQHDALSMRDRRREKRSLAIQKALQKVGVKPYQVPVFSARYAAAKKYDGITLTLRQAVAYGQLEATLRSHLPDANEIEINLFCTRHVPLEVILGPRRRQEKLVSALAEKGLVLRKDSVLCATYIQNGTFVKGTLENLVEEMCLMKWLYEYQNYEQKVKYAAEEEFATCRMMRERVEARVVWNSSRSRVKAELELKKPAIWPWLAPKKNDV